MSAQVTYERAYASLNIKVQKMKIPPGMPDYVPNWFFPNFSGERNGNHDHGHH